MKLFTWNPRMDIYLSMLYVCLFTWGADRRDSASPFFTCSGMQVFGKQKLWYQVLPSDPFGCFKWPFGVKWPPFGLSKGHLEEAGMLCWKSIFYLTKACVCLVGDFFSWAHTMVNHYVAPRFGEYHYFQSTLILMQINERPLYPWFSDIDMDILFINPTPTINDKSPVTVIIMHLNSHYFPYRREGHRPNNGGLYIICA